MEFKEIEELQTNYEESRKKFSETGALLIKNTAKKIFDEYPKLQSFSWEQYTPYFNDGDTCEFSVHEIKKVNGYSIYEYEYGLEKNTENAKENDELKDDNILLNFESYPKKEEDRNKINEIVDDLNTFISSIPDFIMKDIFEDHSEVTINRDGTHNIEECEHD